MRVFLVLLVVYLPPTFPRLTYPLDKLTYQEAALREKVVMEDIYNLVELLKWKDFNETVELMYDDVEISLVFHSGPMLKKNDPIDAVEIFQLMTKRFGDVYMLRTHYGCKVDFNKVYNNLELMFESGLLLNMETWWESTEEIPTKVNMTFLLHRIVLQPCYYDHDIPYSALLANNEKRVPRNLDYAWISKRIMLRFVEFFNVNDWSQMWKTELFHPNASLKWSYHGKEVFQVGVNETVFNNFFNTVKVATSNITSVDFPILYNPFLSVNDFTAIQQVKFTNPGFNVVTSFQWNYERDPNEPWQFAHIHVYEGKVQNQKQQ